MRYNRSHSLFRNSLLAAVLASTSPLYADEVNVQLGATPPSDAIALAAHGIETAIKQLPDTIDDIMKRSGVPGVAVAVVHNGKTVFAKGYGVREIGKQQPIDEQTRFQIASVSKSITATIAALEVSKGTVSWDDPVIKHLPDFKLHDPYVTKHATIADFFAHRTGLPATSGDELENLGFDRGVIIEKLAQIRLEDFRTSYNYANFGTTIGAEAVAAAVGEKWEAHAAKGFFEPMGMKSTSYRYDDFIAEENRATLHAFQDGKFQPLYKRDPDAQAPAGGVSSNVVDLAEWLKLIVSGGLQNGHSMIETASLMPAMRPQSFSSHVQSLNDRSGMYGFGFNINVEANGRASMGHSGAFLMGAGTAFKIVPSADLGIIVLTNGAPIGAAEGIVGQFIDTAMYGKPTRDWFAAYHMLTSGLFMAGGELVV